MVVGLVIRAAAVVHVSMRGGGGGTVSVFTGTMNDTLLFEALHSEDFLVRDRWPRFVMYERMDITFTSMTSWNF